MPLLLTGGWLLLLAWLARMLACLSLLGPLLLAGGWLLLAVWLGLACWSLWCSRLGVLCGAGWLLTLLWLLRLLRPAPTLLGWAAAWGIAGWLLHDAQVYTAGPSRGLGNSTQSCSGAPLAAGRKPAILNICSVVMKRIAAIVLPQLACELICAQEPRTGQRPFAVIVDDEATAQEADSNVVLDAVDPCAWRYGGRPRQTAAEAAAFVGQLEVLHLPRTRIVEALGRVAEIALGFGTTAALELDRPQPEPTIRYPAGAGAGPLDTVWLDVSGCARLIGGEDLLCAELRERCSKLGHRARVAIAGGPRIAQAVARWSYSQSEQVVARGRGAEALASLPIAALPLAPKLMAWMGKLGILRAGDLSRLDRARLAHRLGPTAQDLLELLAGRDPLPLRAWQPPRRVVEMASFEHALEGSEPLLFVLRGLVARAIARLTTRGEACTKATITLAYDSSILSLSDRNRSHSKSGPAHKSRAQVSIALELPIALSREEDLLRAIRVKLERLQLAAPVVSAQLTLAELTSRSTAQLDISKRRGVSPDALPTLLAELSAWVGPKRVGVLRLVNSHRPEAQSQLAAVDPQRSQALSGERQRSAESAHEAVNRILIPEPTRILPQPILVGKLTAGALIGAEHNLFLIDRLRLSTRMDRVEWWTGSPVSRDYARAWLRTGLGGAGGKPSLAHSQPGSVRRHAEQAQHSEAWMFIDRNSRRGYLHGWYD